MSQQLEIKFSDYYYDLIPRPTQEEWKALEQSIKINGLREPIIVNDKGVILDGYTRYEICQNLGINPEYRIKNFKNNDDELRYVLEVNATRRQLNAFQRVELFYDIFKTFRKEAEQNHKDSRFPDKKYPVGGTLIRYSELVGVGQKRCHAAIKIIESNREDLKQQCRSGVLTVNSAFSILIKRTQQSRRNPHGYPSVYNLLKFFKDSPIKDELERILQIYKEKLQ